jgi:hypothetical protein
MERPAGPSISTAGPAARPPRPRGSAREASVPPVPPRRRRASGGGSALFPRLPALSARIDPSSAIATKGIHRRVRCHRAAGDPEGGVVTDHLPVELPPGGDVCPLSVISSWTVAARGMIHSSVIASRNGRQRLTAIPLFVALSWDLFRAQGDCQSGELARAVGRLADDCAPAAAAPRQIVSQNVRS